MIVSFDDVREDLAAFADEPDDVLIEPDGKALFTHAGHEIDCRFEITSHGEMTVVVGGRSMPYKHFIVRHLGQLDVLAERIVARRRVIPAFVDGPARLDTVGEGTEDGRALELLHKQCSSGSAFMTNVTFVTADAGLGKTALLREYQAQQASLFLDGKSPFVFWHVDLQGRQLLRLSEALLGDLGELRVSGLWMPAILRLLRHRALVLAIDGFDELAAEQGSTDALGALATLIRQMEGHGRVIAASRRTFFDTEDYLRRAGLVRGAIAEPCEFDQISLLPWTRTENINYLDKAFGPKTGSKSPDQVYDDVVEAAGGDINHPIVTRPFLFTHIVKALDTYGTSAQEFLGGGSLDRGGVERVISAFVEREVDLKWRFRDSGEPYLTFNQHMRLLATVAEQMYEAQRDRLDLTLIEMLAGVLMDEWRIDPARRTQVGEMVRMHVLLVVPPDGDGSVRAFDHPEFREYFIALALRDHLNNVAAGKKSPMLARFLSIAQLSDATARYVAPMVTRDTLHLKPLVENLALDVSEERRPTFLHVNVGTLLPYLLDGSDLGSIKIAAPVIFSSLVFEGSELANVTFENAMLLNVSIAHVKWENVRFQRCRFVGVTVDIGSTFKGVVIGDCEIDDLRISRDGEILHRDYAPERIEARLREFGLAGRDVPAPAVIATEPETRLYKSVQRVLRLFYRTTTLPEAAIHTRFASDAGYVIDAVIPLLEEHGIVEERPWKGSGQGRIWTIRVPVDRVFAAEEGIGDVRLTKFWSSIRGS